MGIPQKHLNREKKGFGCGESRSGPGTLPRAKNNEGLHY